TLRGVAGVCASARVAAMLRREKIKHLRISAEMYCGARISDYELRTNLEMPGTEREAFCRCALVCVRSSPQRVLLSLRPPRVARSDYQRHVGSSAQKPTPLRKSRGTCSYVPGVFPLPRQNSCRARRQ